MLQKLCDFFQMLTNQGFKKYFKSNFELEV
jgi:hypothetical protein